MTTFQESIDSLIGELGGYVALPNSELYDQTDEVDNGCVRLPLALVIYPRSIEDVALALTFAKTQGLPFTVKGGGLLPIGGGCLTVGLPGFLLGGGYGFVSRSYGMGSDNILSIDFVTPDGRVRKLTGDATDKTDQDLWWACRGGGGGNFGVAVAMTLQVQRPNTPKMLVGEIHYRLSDARVVISRYNEWIETLPDAFACYGYPGQEPDPANAEEKIGKSTLVGDRQAYIRSGILPSGGMTPEVIEIYQRFMDDAPSGDSFVVWTHGGGQIEKNSGNNSSVPHRGGRYIFELNAIWQNPDEMGANIEWAYQFLEALRPHFEGAYVNYIDPLLADWKDMYYGRNYERLVCIKEAVDPENIFGFRQGIGSEYEPDGTEPLDLSPLNRTVC